jgi:hypothetical protein
MSSSMCRGISEEKFRPWLKKELSRATRRSAVLLIAGIVLSAAIHAFSPSLSARWSVFNYELSSAALDQHPVALVRTFATRLRECEYGWKPLGWQAPFNVSQARRQLKEIYPEVASVIDGVPQVPRAAALKRSDPARYEQRLAAYMERHRSIESGRFSALYDRDDPFSSPNANVKLGLFATKLFGLADACLHTIRSIFASGLAGVLLFATVLALSAGPLWQSRRPARVILKLLVWPTLASALIWGAIFFMAIASAVFGGLTPDTSAIALLTTLPLLATLAKALLHLAETLVNQPKKWDGVERRKPRPPPPPPGMTTPPLGGA